jgi:predicted transposase YbfD/YdcC
LALAELRECQATADPSLLSHFQDVPDFRREHGRRHLLIDVLVIAVCATLADCDTFVDMAEYGIDNQVWLRSFLELPNGIPSHDTFRRILGRLAPAPFQRACVSYARAAAQKLRCGNPTDDLAPTSLGQAGPGAPAPPVASVTDSTALTSPAQPTSPPATATAETPLLDLPATPAPTSPCQAGLTESPAVATTASSTRVGAVFVGVSPPPQTLLQGPPVGAQSPLVAEPDRPHGLAHPPARTPEPVPLQVAVGQSLALPAEAAADGPHRHLPVDGKTARGSKDPAAGKSALHRVSIWDSDARLTLGQVAVAAKSNEITAIPEVLKLVDLKGSVVSIDAMGTQEAIAAQIREGGGDFVLAVKENQPRLHEDVVASFARHFARLDGQANASEGVVLGKGEHGRKEKRTYIVLEDVSGIRDQEKWRGVSRLIMVQRECEKSDGTREEERRYFIGSARSGADAYAKWVRDHWGIENRLHWVLDVTFREDESRVRKDHGTENLAMLRRLALGVLGNDRTCKRSMRGKRKRAARNHAYLENILFALPDLDAPMETQNDAPLA